MEPKQIKDLMAAMGRTGIKRLVIKRDDFELELERAIADDVERFSEQLFESGEENPMRNDIELHRSQAFGKRPARHPEEGGINGTSHVGAEELSDDFIKSPMVGTFYTGPSPEDPPFIKVGDRVEADTIVCIIEAMKVMNEVKAGMRGIISEIMTGNGQPIEFGTKLFRINTD